MKRIFSVKKYIEDQERSGKTTEYIYRMLDLWANKCEGLTSDEMFKLGCGTCDDWMIYVFENAQEMEEYNHRTNVFAEQIKKRQNEFMELFAKNIMNDLFGNKEIKFDENSIKGIERRISGKEEMEMNVEIRNIQINTKKKVITVVWSDNTATMCKATNGDIFDEYTGVCICIAKKFAGGGSPLNKLIAEKKHYLDQNEQKKYLAEVELENAKKKINKFVTEKKSMEYTVKYCMDHYSRSIQKDIAEYIKDKYK